MSKSARRGSSSPGAAAPQTTGPAVDLALVHQRFGWILLAISLAFGLLIEVLLGFKAAAVVDPLGNELLSLAHFHGSFLGLVNLIYPLLTLTNATPERQRLDSVLLRVGSVALPLGFLLGAIGHPEGDPSAGILLSPVGALLIIYVAVDRALQTRRT